MKNLRILLAILFFGFLVCATAPEIVSQLTPVSPVKIYYIAADEVMWNYLPHGSNLAGLPNSENEGSPRQTSFRKAVYREYTDATFATLKPRPPQWEHLGILGPLIRADVGDTVKITFKNNTKIACSMHPHGLAYESCRGRPLPTFGPCPNAPGRPTGIPHRSCGLTTRTSPRPTR